jgi:hypothetical protein
MVGEVVALATARLGLGLHDLDGLGIEEVELMLKQWAEDEEARQEREWERMRLLATIVIQPHLKKQISAQELLPFPWERDHNNAPDKPTVSREEAHERFKRIVGLK